MSQQKKKPDNSYSHLRTVWYAKLQSSGFEDAENLNQNLKQTSTKLASKKYQIRGIDRSSYYRVVDNFLNEHKFECRLDKIIWEYYANGLSIRETAQVLKDVKILKTYQRTKVHETLQRLKKIMKEMYGIGPKSK